MTVLRPLIMGFFLLFTPAVSWGETRLMMAEQTGCYWCETWIKEIGPIYPKTPEGQTAPLIQVNIHDPLPDGITVNRPLTFTPTFVLLKDGQEVSRIEGYPGEDFFWGLLGDMLEKADIPLVNAKTG